MKTQSADTTPELEVTHAATPARTRACAQRSYYLGAWESLRRYWYVPVPGGEPVLRRHMLAAEVRRRPAPYQNKYRWSTIDPFEPGSPGGFPCGETQSGTAAIRYANKVLKAIVARYPMPA